MKLLVKFGQKVQYTRSVLAVISQITSIHIFYQYSTAGFMSKTNTNFGTEVNVFWRLVTFQSLDFPKKK